MPTVFIESDAAHRFDEAGGRFVEVCRRCGAPREADAKACACGAGFERVRRGLIVQSWDPVAVGIRLPATCPHCLGTPTRERHHTFTAVTGPGGPGMLRTACVELAVPVCARVPHPLLVFFVGLVSLTSLGLFGLVALMLATAGAVPLGLGVAVALSAAGVAWSWRARGWFRLVGFDHRAYRLRVRRGDYAFLLAAANGGRVGWGLRGRRLLPPAARVVRRGAADRSGDQRPPNG